MHRTTRIACQTCYQFIINDCSLIASTIDGFTTAEVSHNYKKISPSKYITNLLIIAQKLTESKQASFVSANAMSIWLKHTSRAIFRQNLRLAHH